MTAAGQDKKIPGCALSHRRENRKRYAGYLKAETPAAMPSG